MSLQLTFNSVEALGSAAQAVRSGPQKETSAGREEIQEDNSDVRELIAVRGSRNPEMCRAVGMRGVVDPLEGIDLGKMNLQLIANEENQDRTQCGKNETGGMISFVCWARKHVGYGTADDRSDDAEHDRPEDRHMHVHHRSRDNPRDEPNDDIPD